MVLRPVGRAVLGCSRDAGSDPGNGTSTAAEYSKRAGDDVVGESRWPTAGAVLAAMVLTILLPGTLRLGPQWVLPLVEGLLLVAVSGGDPAVVTIARRPATF
jgi:hypothetical protein